MTRHRSHRTKIIATSGDAHTGLRDGSPQTRNPKGIATAEAIDERSEQITIYEIDKAIAEEIQKERARTWILLYYRDAPVGKIRAELSNPCETEPGQHVTEWRERILMPEIDVSDVIASERPDNGPA